MNGHIVSVILASVMLMVAGFVRVIGLFMLAIWTLWCACALVLIAVAVVSDVLGCPRRVSFSTGMDVWLYTAIGEAGVICILLSRRLDSWAQPPVDDATA